MRSHISIVGIENLVDLLETAAQMDSVKRTVRFWGAELQRRAVRKAVFRGHYRGKEFIKPTGNLRRSIQPPKISIDGMEALVTVQADYGAYVELGTRYMEAQPYMAPALNEVEAPFLRDLANSIGDK